MPPPRLSFEFDPAKAASNLRKHGVDFFEASTVFNDPLSSTLADDQHSLDEVRLITIGMSSRQRVLFVVYTESPQASGSSVPASPPRPRSANMKKSPELDPLAARPNLDFSKGVRGKYFNQLQQGTNLVILDPALMPYFPDSDSVNRALHAFLAIGDSIQAAAPPRRRLKSTAPRSKAAFDPRKGSVSSALASGE